MTSLNKTFLLNQTYENRSWFITESKGQKIRRLAKIIIDFLKEKLRPNYGPYLSIDVEDSVILKYFLH